MNTKIIITASIALLISANSYAINDEYRKLLERSGCTQMSEAQGCDIHKTKEENANASAMSQTADDAKVIIPNARQWLATASSGATVANIQIDDKNQVWVNGKHVKSSHSDGAIKFKQGMVEFTIYPDASMNKDSSWIDTDAGTQGSITAK
ncbi:hypothetical protein [Shewanella putrefaciens]|jgi:hypothetical protein|uniref:hypothetical protein n=1 Tax=Shewanella oncorhynchi TaxID=2726434 RepID=UPI000DEAD108|nr:hypothetical protein DET47_11735 [Shewanella putrefaciens]